MSYVLQQPLSRDSEQSQTALFLACIYREIPKWAHLTTWPARSALVADYEASHQGNPDPEGFAAIFDDRRHQLHREWIAGHSGTGKTRGRDTSPGTPLLISAQTQRDEFGAFQALERHPG